MSHDPKFDQAKRLIDEFAAQLLELNDGKKIPSTWAICLKSALKSKPRRPGVKPDYKKIAEIVKRLTLEGKKVRQGRKKHHNPADYKDNIARDLGVSRKTVERVDEMRPHFIKEINRLDSLEPRKRRAVIDGLSAAICERRKASDEAKEKLRRKKQQQVLDEAREMARRK